MWRLGWVIDSFVYLGPIGLGIYWPFGLGNGLYVLGYGLHGLHNGLHVLGNGPHWLGFMLQFGKCHFWHYVAFCIMSHSGLCRSA